MRKQPVNVLRYLPEFLPQDPTFKKIQDALSKEHENYRLKLVDISKQFYIETADWGLEDWEKFLKITPKKGSDKELRRSVIAVKRRGGQMMTVEHTKEVMREFAPYGEVDIEELGENRLKLIINNGNFEWDELMQALWDLLPAHLIFDFGIYEDLGEETVHYAQATADATWENFELDMLSPPAETVLFNIFPVDIGTDTFYPDSADEHSNHENFLKYTVLSLAAETTIIDCDRAEILDEDTIEDFERWIRARWAEFKTNPVVKWYKHGTHGVDEGEIDNPDDEEFFPVDMDFLRLYFSMQDSETIRYLTVYQPRNDVEGKEINALSAVSKNLLMSRRGFYSDKIIRALYVQKQELKII